MNDCSQHKKELFGQTDMKVVAEAIGDLHYQAMAELLKHLSQKLKQDSRKDWHNGKIQVAARLREASVYAKFTYTQIISAWQICKPFMNTSPSPKK